MIGSERMTVENISWSISIKKCCETCQGLNPRLPDHQYYMTPAVICCTLTLKVPIITAADDTLNFILFFFQNKYILTFHVNHLHHLFSLKKKKKKIQYHLLQVLLGLLRVNQCKLDLLESTFGTFPSGGTLGLGMSMAVGLETLNLIL